MNTGVNQAALHPVISTVRGQSIGRSEFVGREGFDALLVFGEHEDAGPAPVSYDNRFFLLFALSAPGSYLLTDFGLPKSELATGKDFNSACKSESSAARASARAWVFRR